MSRSFPLPPIKLICAAALMSAAMFSEAKAPQPLDVGAMSLARGSAPMTVTVALKLRDPDQLQSLVQSLHTPDSPQFHQFLTPDQFHARFAPTDAVVNQAIAHFKSQGLTATLSSSSMLKVSGSPDALNKAFGVQLHLYDVAAAPGKGAFRFHAPVGTPQVSSPAVAANVEAVLGFDNAPHFRPHLARASAVKGVASRATPAAKSGTTINEPGELTVKDVAQYYNVTPLYNQGYDGKGRTMAIVTLAAFNTSDVAAYWQYAGVNADVSRIKTVTVGVGPGAPSDASGSDETTLDVEQAGGMAPGAKIIVYQSANEDQDFVDAFARAVDDNKADSISTSWGEWEWFETLNTVTSGHRSVDVLHAFNNVFLQAALQGQTMFAASGDAGAYDFNNPYLPPDFSLVLSVDSPAASPWMTAAGGTTLPGTQMFTLHTGATFTAKIPKERVWGWDYLEGLCDLLQLDYISCGIFPVGGGGGVSSYQAKPFYQEWVSGTKTTEPGQSLIEYGTPDGDVTDVTLPTHYRGRNVPDVSLNADPETGYLLFYTSQDPTNFPFVTGGNGGTSFVSPQLNGIAALLGQRVHGRLGLLNVPLYLMAATPLGYLGNNAPLNDVTAGNNWFYKGAPGYDPGSGVGTLDVANFAKALLLLGY